MFFFPNPGMQWNLKHEIQENGPSHLIHWVKEDELAIATKGSIQVYKVNADESIPVFALISYELYGLRISSLATNGANPNAIYVICDYKPYVYQFPCQHLPSMLGSIPSWMPDSAIPLRPTMILL